MISPVMTTESLSGKQAPTQQNNFVKQTKNQNRDRAATKVLTTQIFIGRRNNGRVGKRFSAAARSSPILRFVCAGLFVFRRVLVWRSLRGAPKRAKRVLGTS